MPAGAIEWIEFTLSEEATVHGVALAGGTLPGWGAVAAYLNGARIESARDGNAWVTAATISGVSDESRSLRTITFAPVTARHFGIARSGDLATSEVSFLERNAARIQRCRLGKLILVMQTIELTLNLCARELRAEDCVGARLDRGLQQARVQCRAAWCCGPR